MGEPVSAAEADKSSKILKFGKIAFVAVLITAAGASTSPFLGEAGSLPRVLLLIIIGPAMMTSFISGGVGTLRYLMSFNERNKTGAEHLGFALSLTPFVAIFIAIQVLEAMRE